MEQELQDRLKPFSRFLSEEDYQKLLRGLKKELKLRERILFLQKGRRDGVRTALTDDSKNAFLIIECVEPERVEDCQAAIDELAELVERYLGATIKTKELITSEHREAVIAA